MNVCVNTFMPFVKTISFFLPVQDFVRSFVSPSTSAPIALNELPPAKRLSYVFHSIQLNVFTGR